MIRLAETWAVWTQRVTSAIILAAMWTAMISATRADDPPAPDSLAVVDANPKIPTLEQVVGHSWGADISNAAEVLSYCESLAAAAPDRCKLERYGRSYQGKDLAHMIITSPANLRRLDEIRRQNLALADPRATTPARADELARDLPAIVWLAYCVHGNEASPSDAALLTAYHLLADRGKATRDWLDKVVVLIDPLQNPDGRDRFVSFHRESRGSFAQEHPLASDRLERWPTGRFNHYLFDMNRDWFLQSQKESAARVEAFLKWKPHIFVDAHEMNADSNFYFDPATDPYNGHTLPRQKEWHFKIGRAHAAAFDRHGIAYTTREMFDSFGPQYGSTWPIFHGSIAILWEQAGARGPVVAREDKTKLRYRDGVRNHHISGLATIETAARDRAQLVRDFYDTAADSVKLGSKGSVRSFFLLEKDRPGRTAALAKLLHRNGIEVRRTSAEITVAGRDVASSEVRDWTIPAGSHHVDLAQPASRLALTLLERHHDMGSDYIKRQETRVARGLPDEIYDATAWSLPLAFDVPCIAVGATVKVAGDVVRDFETPGTVVGGRGKLGYLIDAHDDGLLPALAEWHQAGLRAHVLSEPTRVHGHDFARGSVFLRTGENPGSLHDAMTAAAGNHGLRVFAVNTGFVEEGASLGGPHVHWARPPRVLLAFDRPAGNEVGHTWFLFDQVWRYPVTRVATRALGEVDWSSLDVCILPHGVYKADAPNEDVVRRLKDWVQDGGTLILVGGAAAWATDPNVNLLASSLAKRDLDAPPTKSGSSKKIAGAKKQDKKAPLAVPGAFVRVAVDDDHFATWGLGKNTVFHLNGDRVFSPLKKSAGKNLITMSRDPGELLVSGYCWPETLKMLPGTPYLMHQSLGRGHILAFADDPNARAFSPHSRRAFFNAVFFSLPARRDAP